MPVVSTDCQFGPSDILTDEKLGRLVQADKIEQLVAAMAYYVDNLRYEKTYSDYRKAYVSRFDVDQIVDVHAAAILTAAGRAPVKMGDVPAFEAR